MKPKVGSMVSVLRRNLQRIPWQVSWLTGGADRAKLLTFRLPRKTSDLWKVSFPAYSGGTAPALHRLPF